MRYLIYLRLVWLPCLNGILILGVPLLIFVFILSILLRGFIFNIEIYSLSKGCTTDQNCIITYFDKFFYLPQIEMNILRGGRIGLIFIAAAAYCVRLSVKIIMPIDVSTPKYDYTGNIFLVRAWQQSFVIFLNFILVFLMNLFINFSTTKTFADGIIIFQILFKPCLSFIEFFFELALNDKLFLAPVGTVLGVLENFVTFGAENFLAFI